MKPDYCDSNAPTFVIITLYNKALTRVFKKKKAKESIVAKAGQFNDNNKTWTNIVKALNRFVPCVYEAFKEVDFNFYAIKTFSSFKSVPLGC